MAQVSKKPQPSKERGRRIRIRPAYIILLILMGLFAYKFVEKTRELQQLTRQANALRAANQQTMRENAHIAQAIKFYRTPAFIEQRARSALGYTGPNDVPIISNPHYEKATVRAAPRLYAAPVPTWRQWWDSFFH